MDYIAEHLNPSGRAGVIVPEGIIFQSQKAYQNLRKMLVEDFLWAVVSLPAGVFNPYSGVKTSILLMDKTLVKKTDKILFVKIENDGFDLGAQRRPIDKNDLPLALQFIKKYQKAVPKGREADETGFAHAVEKAKIAESGDWNLSGERYRENYESRISNYEWIQLGEICQIKPPKSEVKRLDREMEVSFVPMKDLGEKQIKFSPIETRKIGDVIGGYTYFRDGDVLLAKITPCFENGKSGIAGNLLNEIGFGSTEFIVFRPNERILPEWIYYSISNEKFLLLGRNNMTGSAGQQRVAIDFVKKYKIPLPPLDVQKAIVAEIDGYQKIIDGARQVVDNYKPTIKIDPDWKMVALGEVAQFRQGKQVNRELHLTEPKDGYVRFIRIIDYTQENEDIRYVPDPGKRYYCDKEDSIMVRYGAVGFVGRGIEGVYANNLFKIDLQNENIDKGFLYYWLWQDKIQSFIKNNMQASGLPAINHSIIRRIEISLPPLSVQQEIVAQIEAEQEMVNANKKLIETFEQKIKDKISEVWKK